MILTSDVHRVVDVPANGGVQLEWPATSTVGQSGDVTLDFEVTAPGLSDAVELKMPLLTWGASETVSTAGEVAPADTVTEQVDLPNEIDPNRGALTNISGSLASALRYSLRHVEEYPYECLEQTVSRFLPRLALERAINQWGLGDPLNLKPQLPGLVTRSIQRIYRYHHPNGGWSFWPEDSVSQPYLSAYKTPGRSVAVKTGTTSDFRDNWTIGFTPDVVVGVWVGNPDNRPMRDVSGVSGAAPLWRDLVDKLLNGTGARQFERPSDLAQVALCSTSESPAGYQSRWTLWDR